MENTTKPKQRNVQSLKRLYRRYFKTEAVAPTRNWLQKLFGRYHATQQVSVHRVPGSGFNVFIQQSDNSICHLELVDGQLFDC